MKKSNYIIPIFIPHIGCPNDCTFCNQNKITGNSVETSTLEAKLKIKEYLVNIPKEAKNIEIAFFGGSFTGIDMDLQKEFLSIARQYKKDKKINKIRLSTRPDYINKEIVLLLKEYLVDIVELGIQSMNDSVLKKINRGHTVEDTINAANIINENNITLGAQVMVGLPGDSYDSFIKTIKDIILLKPKIARIYPVLVIKETKMEEDYLNGKFIPITIKDSIKYCKEAMYLFESSNINVIRVGLQPSDNINIGKDIVAGPFHPAYRQLVESEMYFDIIDNALSKIDKESLKHENIKINVGKNKVSLIAGQKGINRKKLLKKYDLRDIKILGKETNNVSINVCRKEFTLNIEEDMKKLYSHSDK